jgi:hypothetical protein
MNQKVKNSNTPFYPTHPVQDQFGTLMVSFGISKREQLAMQIFINTSFVNSASILTRKSLTAFGKHPTTIIDLNDTEQINDYVKSCFDLADKFLDFEPIEENKIVL